MIILLHKNAFLNDKKHKNLQKTFHLITELVAEREKKRNTTDQNNSKMFLLSII